MVFKWDSVVDRYRCKFRHRVPDVIAMALHRESYMYCSEGPAELAFTPLIVVSYILEVGI